MPVSVATVVQSDVATWDEFSGRLEAVERVDIRSRVAGTVQSVHFREGALVNKGDLLITIDPAPYAADVERAAAQVVAAQARAVVHAQRSRARPAPARRTGHRAARVRRTQQRAARSRRQPARRTGGAADRAAEPRLHAGARAGRRPRRQARDHGRQPGRRRPGRAGADDAGVGEPDLRELRRRRADRDARAARSSAGAARARAHSSNASRCRWARAADAHDTPFAGQLQLVDNQVDAKSGTVRVRAVFDNKDGSADAGPVRAAAHGPGEDRARRCWSTNARSAPTRTRSS